MVVRIRARARTYCGLPIIDNREGDGLFGDFGVAQGQYRTLFLSVM